MNISRVTTMNYLFNSARHKYQEIIDLSKTFKFPEHVSDTHIDNVTNISFYKIPEIMYYPVGEKDYQRKYVDTNRLDKIKDNIIRHKFTGIRVIEFLLAFSDERVIKNILDKWVNQKTRGKFNDPSLAMIINPNLKDKSIYKQLFDLIMFDRGGYRTSITSCFKHFEKNVKLVLEYDCNLLLSIPKFISLAVYKPELLSYIKHKDLVPFINKLSTPLLIKFVSTSALLNIPFQLSKEDCKQIFPLVVSAIPLGKDEHSALKKCDIDQIIIFGQDLVKQSNFYGKLLYVFKLWKKYFNYDFDYMDKFMLNCLDNFEEELFQEVDFNGWTVVHHATSLRCKQFLYKFYYKGFKIKHSSKDPAMLSVQQVYKQYKLKNLLKQIETTHEQ